MQDKEINPFGILLIDCKLSLRVFAGLYYFLQDETPFKYIAEFLANDDETVTDYANLLREEYGRNLIETRQLLGGPVIRVQIDECLLAKSKRTRDAHARPVRQQWVFGAYDVVPR